MNVIYEVNGSPEILFTFLSYLNTIFLLFIIFYFSQITVLFQLIDINIGIK